jgi:ABC-2 type transport system permease protein
MLRNVLLKTLWEQRRSLFWWAVGIILLSLYTAGLYPSINTPGFTEYMKQLPAAITALFGESFSLATAQGYQNAYFFDMMGPIFFVIYAIAVGSSAIAGEEDRGTLDLVLSSPMQRWAVVLHKFAAMVAGTLVLAFFLWFGLALAVIIANMKISLWLLAQACLGSVLVGLVFGSLALATGCVRGSRGLSIGLPAAVTLAAYVLKTYAPLVEGMKPLEKLSPFYYSNAAKPLVNGLNLGDTAILLGIILILLAIALVAFQRRDVAV